jgi:hypothetical protein
MRPLLDPADLDGSNVILVPSSSLPGTVHDKNRGPFYITRRPCRLGSCSILNLNLSRPKVLFVLF